MRAQCVLPTVIQLLLLLHSALTYSTYSEAAPDYVLESKAECHYRNGTQKVKFLNRYLYNREELVYFDSDVGYFIAKTELGRPTAESWNKDQAIIEQKKAYVETFCVHNYDIIHGFTADRRVKPTIKISLMPHHEEEHMEHHMLACNVYGFYPSAINVKWYRNGQEVTDQAQSTELFQNGDWTFQILVILETKTQKGDIFTCEVHHKSLEEPARVDWHPQTSDSARSKLATGIGGFVLGSILIIAGVLVYIKGQKALTLFRGPQTEHFIHT